MVQGLEPHPSIFLLSERQILRVVELRIKAHCLHERLSFVAVHPFPPPLLRPFGIC